ncbi:MAG: ribonuclease Y [Deltaproteobacteria bacterium]|nr:ribonuclease Y [Deltaproteobacteria bacterium]MDZ4224997.1 ribonuclease Y [bacterium]
MGLEWIIGGVVGLLAGIGGGFYARVVLGKRKLHEAENRAKSVLDDAENRAKTIKKEAELEAKDTQLKAKAHFEREFSEKQREIHNLEKRLQAKEDNLEKKFNLLETKEEELFKQEKGIVDKKEHLGVLERQYQEQILETRRALERAAAITTEDAKKQLKESLLEDAKRESATLMMKIEEEAKAEANKKGKYIIASTIERLASDYVSERSLSTVPLPNEELKGRIIGREGRNIRAFEAATGIDVVIDETPDAVILSGFNPVRREIARITMERLLQDGRIHPSRIEEMVAKVTDEINQSIIEAGEQAFMELKLPKAHPEIVKLLGALKYRYSYAQNVLRHSIECGFVCGMMAAELGIDEMKARRAGLLHDIGKAVSHEVEGAHALIGMDFCKKYKEDEGVCHAVGAHHEDIPQIYALDSLVDAADALSGARPGARREVLESYIKRLEDLEKISLSFNGVEKAYAVQAGREIRVMVNFQEVTDAQAFVISKDIAKKIEQEMTYPGQIKVTVIRETRATEYAK